MKKTIPDLVSVVLVNFRGADDTVEAIRGLRELDWPQHLLEIIVVENGSGDDSVAKLRAVPGKVTVVESRENLGFTGGCNLGVSRATGEYLAFLNNDAKPAPDWISSAVATFRTSPDIGAVASKVLDWEGDRIDFIDAAVTWYGMGYKPHAGERDQGKWDVEKDVLFGTGAALFVRAKAFAEVGGFDDNFFMFYDDVDLGWRLNLLGHRVRFQPKSLVFHKHHASIEKFGDFREQYLLERNALYALYKNLDDASLAQVLPGAILLATRRSVARGSLASGSLDLRVPGDDGDRMMSVDKSTLAGVFAIDQFVENLPTMAGERTRVQSTRRVSDRQLKSLFGETDEPAYPSETYLQGYENIAQTLGILDIEGKRRVVVVTGDPVGIRMAGPAIRASNIARVLARENDVRLISTTAAISIDPSYEVFTVPPTNPRGMEEHEKWADVIIVQGHALQYFPSLESTSKVTVVDIYDPMHLEQLEQGRERSMREWNEQVGHSNEALNHQLARGDFFLCASERQRHFWLGQLAGLGRVNAYTYSRDDKLRSLIDVVPFGTPSDAPVAEKLAIKGVVPGIDADDKVVIWGGGIYNWFDTQTLIRAMAILSERRPTVRLFFMGVKHPSPNVPEMAAVSQARDLTSALGLNGHVFFNESWVPYEQRQNYLLDADLGVSTHFDHVETTFSFRTRILDYLWAGLPIVSTEGDAFAELIEADGLGAVVPERDAATLASAMERLLFDDAEAERARTNVRRVREDFVWDKVLAPLVEFCRHPVRAADKRDDIPAPGGTTKDLVAAARRPRSSNHSGRRRDLDRAIYYLRNGGFAAVTDRYKARRARLRAAATR
ncbi:glycosyltransferase [Demequina lutea]|uniref:Glycosyltransferase 2-like domain-containing protein n=1 Tax=Demequina lutea TaxID=431489 RepID=A0A7Y9ZDX2_9MICO|nr:glycosyltransferase [Demequina lutea]NYI42458.1 hypothetical protein [Demequina lutea]